MAALPKLTAPTIAVPAITVLPLDPLVVSTYVGLVGRTGATVNGLNAVTGTLGLGARLDVTTTGTGAWSGTLTIGTTKYTLKGNVEQQQRHSPW